MTRDKMREFLSKDTDDIMARSSAPYLLSWESQEEEDPELGLECLDLLEDICWEQVFRFVVGYLHEFGSVELTKAERYKGSG
jgi:hypothetical protein